MRLKIEFASSGLAGLAGWVHCDVPSAAWAWADLAGWSGSRIRNLERLDPDLQLENAHLGRGRDFYDVEVPYI